MRTEAEGVIGPPPGGPAAGGMYQVQAECFQTVWAHRVGWPGVWDALVAALRRRERLSVPRDLRVVVSVTSDVRVRPTVRLLGPVLQLRPQAKGVRRLR